MFYILYSVINSTATNNNNKGNNMARKHNYLNNKDLLLEIHKSKNTYCVYRDPETDHDFDIILMQSKLLRE
jgi:hypothetical protein